jgi:hypothetical protein
MSVEVVRERTYGNWRQPRSAGIGRLGLLGTAVLMVGVVLVILTVSIVGVLPGLVLLGALGLGMSSLLVRDRHGKTGAQLIMVRAGWWRARSSGAHLYRSGPLGRVPWGSYQLPGLAAQSRLIEARDGYDRPFGLVSLPSVGHYTVVIATEPDGASLVDREQVDVWVARWGEWLSALGDEPGLLAATVTVETAPDTGERLRREVCDRIDPDAPELAQQVLREVVESYPLGSATIKAWVSLTFVDTNRSRRRGAPEFARDLATRLPGITQRLQGTGAGGTRPVGAQELCEIVRGAYDPQAARTIEEAYAAGQVPRIRWADAGPAAAQASWDCYRHDGAVSVTWAMTAAPRGEVHSSVLWKLLAPHRDVARKRVSVLYRVLDPGVAARVVEADKRNADFRVNSAQRPSEHVIREQRSAWATAQEEARGAGLVDFGMLITATVEEQVGGPGEELAQAAATIDTLAATARLGIRRVYGSQDSAFAACLPLGLVLPRHLKVPDEVRRAL